VYNTYGAAVAQVEVNCLTGIYTILKVDIVMDVGKSLNPAIDIGQIEGGFVMGIGYHALEEHRYGPDGCLQTSGAGKYHIPSVSSIPLEMNVTLLKDSGNPKAVYSSKGIGEPSLLLSSAVFFAIRDAVVAARSEAGLPSQFTLNSPATVRDILLACTKA
jgi:xanthine dehydrogenase molybdopterin-binding subunit B